jgi:hypothetical protein
MRVWWCNQSRLWNDERPAGLVCAVEAASRQGSTYRETVGAARRGDIIVHYLSRKKHYNGNIIQGIAAISRVREDGQICTITLRDHYPLSSTGYWYWAQPRWYLETEYCDLHYPISIASVRRALVKLDTVPILPNGTVRQAYFMPFDARGLHIIGQAINAHEVLPDWARAALGLTTDVPADMVPVPSETPDSHPATQVAPPVPLNLTEPMIPARRERIMARYQDYTDQREQALANLYQRIQQGNAELTRLYRNQVERLDNDIASSLSQMRTHARQELAELEQMSRDALYGEIVRLRDRDRVYGGVATAALRLNDTLNTVTVQMLKDQGVPIDALVEFQTELRKLTTLLETERQMGARAPEASDMP